MEDRELDTRLQNDRTLLIALIRLGIPLEYRHSKSENWKYYSPDSYPKGDSDSPSALIEALRKNWIGAAFWRIEKT